MSRAMRQQRLMSHVVKPASPSPVIFLFVNGMFRNRHSRCSTGPKGSCVPVRMHRCPGAGKYLFRGMHRIWKGWELLSIHSARRT